MRSTETRSTFITSALSLLLCVAMLIGTTFAWFTDTASTGVNKIQAGNLDLEIVDMGEQPIDSLDWVAADGRAQEAILWEPGATYKLEPFKIKNKGSLALKFKFEIEGLSGNAKLLEAIDFTYTDDQDQTFDVTEEIVLNAGDATAPITLTGRMKNTAGNEYQGLSLDSISITVVATQATVESDSFDNQYDKDAPLDFVAINDESELTALLADAEADEDITVSLNTDVSLDTFYLLSPDTNNTPELGDIVVQANGHEISTSKADTSRAVRIEYSDVVRDITIIGAKITTKNTTPVYNEDRGVAVYDVHNATINLINCEIVCDAPQYTAGVRLINSTNLTVNIKNCNITASNAVSLMNTKNSTINIDGCVLNSNYEGTASYLGHGIYIDSTTASTGNVFNVSNTTYEGKYAEPFSNVMTPPANTYNDLGGNVDNTEKIYK